MSREFTQKMFLFAAIFNGLIGLGLLFIPGPFLDLIFITPALENPTWANLFGWLVTLFGVAYYWISRDPESNRQLILLGIIGKLGVAAIALANVLAGNISWQIMIPAGADALWAALFLRALGSLGDKGR